MIRCLPLHVLQVLSTLWSDTFCTALCNWIPFNNIFASFKALDPDKNRFCSGEWNSLSFEYVFKQWFFLIENAWLLNVLCDFKIAFITAACENIVPRKGRALFLSRSHCGKDLKDFGQLNELREGHIFPKKWLIKKKKERSCLSYHILISRKCTSSTQPFPFLILFLYIGSACWLCLWPRTHSLYYSLNIDLKNACWWR